MNRKWDKGSIPIPNSEEAPNLHFQMTINKEEKKTTEFKRYMNQPPLFLPELLPIQNMIYKIPNIKMIVSSFNVFKTTIPFLTPNL